LEGIKELSLSESSISSSSNGSDSIPGSASASQQDNKNSSKESKLEISSFRNDSFDIMIHKDQINNINSISNNYGRNSQVD